MEELKVNRITDLESFKQIKEDWDRLYQNDSNATLDISWFWIYNSFKISTYKWIVLGVQDLSDSTYVAFLPLNIYKRGKFGIYPVSQIIYAGKPQSTYPGFLCLPDFEFRAIRSLASYIINNLSWDQLQFNWIKDTRINIFTNSFLNGKFSVELNTGLTSLCLNLPERFQSYLSNLKKSTRCKIRNRLKNVLESEEYNLKYSNNETVERDIESICNLWYNRWNNENIATLHRKILLSYYQKGLLWLSMIWNGKKPVAGLACLLDPAKMVCKAYITSFDRAYGQLSPGIVLFSESIKRAIEENYQYYDFTVGLDPYKRAFGPELIETKNISIKRKGIKSSVMFSVMGALKKVSK